MTENHPKIKVLGNRLLLMGIPRPKSKIILTEKAENDLMASKTDNKFKIISKGHDVKWPIEVGDIVALNPIGPPLMPVRDYKEGEAFYTIVPEYEVSHIILDHKEDIQPATSIVIESN